MPYIGNPIYQSAFVTDQFSGDGTTTAFTMSVAPAGTTNVLVVVSGVVQDPSTYGVTGTTLNFSAAPPSGTGNISCRYLGVPVTGVTTTAYRTVTEFTATAGQTTFTPPSYNVGFINVYLNGVLLGSADYTATNGTTVVLATGASAGNLVTVESFQISSVANAIQNAAGSVSNSNIATGAVTAAKMAASSVNLASSTVTDVLPIANGGTGGSYVAQYVVVGGGGGGGGASPSGVGAGGAGAGGMLSGSTTLTSGTVYTVTVGSGGAGSSAYAVAGTNGSNSVFGSLIAYGGGGGGWYNSANTGGSGGGITDYVYAPTIVPGSGVDGQGFPGARSSVNLGNGSNSGGGGGAGGAGSTLGLGGPGNATYITGSAVTLAGGGSGGQGLAVATSFPGGIGGGGAGGAGNSGGTAGTANTGGGGGGASAYNSGTYTGGAGGSGVVYISVPTANYTGTTTGSPTVTTNGSNTVLKWTSAGSYTA